jgi:hypothetical protein
LVNFDLTPARVTTGNVAKWGEYTTGPFRNVEILGGGHYFVSTHYRAVVDVVREQLVGLMAGGLMEGHSWIEEHTGAPGTAQVQRVHNLSARHASISQSWHASPSLPAFILHTS